MARDALEQRFAAIELLIYFSDRPSCATIDEECNSWPAMTPPPNPDKPAARLTKEQLSRLKAEAASPYRGLRKLIYFTFGASGLIGGLIFFLGLLAGRQGWSEGLPNLGVQVGVVALMIWLWRIDRDRRS